MIFELPNGETVAITGSHNFHALGGLLGTREVAMQTTDPHIIAELQRFLNDHVKTAPEKNLTVLDI